MNTPHPHITACGGIAIPVTAADGKVMYHYTIDAELVTPSMRDLWMAQLSDKPWFTDDTRRRVEDIYDGLCRVYG